MASSPSSTPSELLIDALATFEHETDVSPHDFSRALAAVLRADDAPLVERLLTCAAAHSDGNAMLGDFVGHAARILAPNDDAPADGASAAAWTALVSVADSLNGSGVHALGRLGFVSDALFRRLVDEAHQELSTIAPLGANRAIAPAGDALAALAVSRQLRETLSRALGFAVTPTYDALYEYDPPGAHVQTHVDSRGYDIVFHLLLEHEVLPNGGRGHSILTAHLPNETTPTRISLQAGEAVVLCGRGTVHSWKALGVDERRILTAIGFRRATS